MEEKLLEILLSTLKQQQWEKCKGHLQSFLILEKKYNYWRKLEKLVNRFIYEVENKSLEM